MAYCINCGKESKLVTRALELCADCIQKDFKKLLTRIEKAHSKSRKQFNLPLKPPEDADGIKCNYCVNECKIGEDKTGYCGLRYNSGGKIYPDNPDEANLSFYFDPLPTNCVADWVCPAGSSCGYPEYSYSRGPEYGYKNLAVFFQACSFNCLFCQNWHYKEKIFSSKKITSSQLADVISEKTACVCYFGGDPTPQLPFAIKFSELALEKNKDRILRICWETNGAMSSSFLKKMADLSLRSGGCIKFDLKTFSDELNIALCGVTNKRTKENFKYLAKLSEKRKEPPFLVASTLLIPGYVDEEEVSKIAKFIARLNPEIPYSLLAFYPCFYINDLPTTSKKHAENCKRIALEAGLKRVKIGNIHLLSEAY